MTIVGGLRSRLLRDSLYAVIDEGLTTLGWFAVDRSHRPVRFQREPANWQEAVEPNLIALSLTTVDNNEVEVGSWLTTDSITAYLDIFAESDALGLDVSNDLRDLLRGRLLDAAAHGTIPIYDYRHATPPIIGYVSVMAASALRNMSVTGEPWMRHWFRVAIELQDSYYSTEA